MPGGRDARRSPLGPRRQHVSHRRRHAGRRSCADRRRHGRSRRRMTPSARRQGRAVACRLSGARPSLAGRQHGGPPRASPARRPRRPSDAGRPGPRGPMPRQPVGPSGVTPRTADELAPGRRSTASGRATGRVAPARSSTCRRRPRTCSAHARVRRTGQRSAARRPRRRRLTRSRTSPPARIADRGHLATGREPRRAVQAWPRLRAGRPHGCAQSCIDRRHLRHGGVTDGPPVLSRSCAQSEPRRATQSNVRPVSCS